MKIRLTVTLLQVLLLTCYAHAQTYRAYINRKNHPDISKPVYNFTIKDVHEYPKKVIKLHELKGQNIILDFWHKECVACIQSFPKMNELQKKFKGDVKIILVGLEDETNRIRGMYDLLKSRYNLELTHAFDSLAFWNICPSGAAPHLVWIDKNGIVQAVTNQASENDIQDFVNGKKFVYKDYSYAAQMAPRGYDGMLPFLIDGNGGEATDFLYRSVLSEYKQGKPMAGTYGSIERSLTIAGMVQGTFALRYLYRLAYTGEYEWVVNDSLYGVVYPQMALEIKDSTAFMEDFNKSKGLYTYSLIVPPAKATVKHVMETMQRDLKTYFGYDATVETRNMPCWKLVASEKAKQAIKFKPAGSKPGGRYDYTGYELINTTMRGVMAATFLNAARFGAPVIDKTGIEGTFDFELSNVRLNVWDDVVKALKEKGFDLIKEEMPMKVIVVRDPKL